MRKYGWKPDFPDQRDLKYSVPAFAALTSTNNRNKTVMPPIQDQGQLGSCTGNGIASIMNWLYLNGHIKRQTTDPVPFSRLFIYYNERVLEGTIKEDSGAQIRDGIKVVASKGACSETMLPYDISKFTKKPSSKAYAQATRFQALQYQRIDNSSLQQLVGCLQEGYPFVFGFSVYESFESATVARTGIVPIPSHSESLLGGHCVWCIDYDAVKRGFWCVNSWGENWGKLGYFFMPQDYLLDN